MTARGFVFGGTLGTGKLLATFGAGSDRLWGALVGGQGYHALQPSTNTPRAGYLTLFSNLIPQRWVLLIFLNSNTPHFL